MAQHAVTTRRIDRRHIVFAAAIAVFLLLLIAYRLGRHSIGRVIGGPAVPPPELTILLTADTRGHLEPCGCRSDQSGGLPVRATLVKTDSSRQRLLVDAGNVTYGNRKYDLIKFNYILQGMEAIGYNVVNLGVTEAMLTKDELLEVTRSHPKLKFISCNVVDARTRRPIVEPYAIEEMSGFRVGILGVVRNELEVVGKGLAVLPPVEALSEWVPRVAGQCDYLLVAAFVNQEQIRTIANRFYEVDGILGGDVSESSNYPETVNRALVFSVTDKGKVLGKVRLRRSKNGRLEVAGGQGIKVRDGITSDNKMLSLVREFKDELQRRHIELAQTDEHLEPIVSPNRSPLADRYVGAETCMSCHPSAHRIWKASPHTGSLQVLKPKNNQFDPECLSCHTMGYGAGDGYISESKTPQFSMVQCENCHGRGQRHAEAMIKGEKLAFSTFRAVTPNVCIKCHDKENSENFNFASFWERIKHNSEGKRMG